MLRALLDRLAGGPSLDDPAIGRLRFHPDSGHWTGRVDFPPTGRKVLVHLTAGREGPGTIHREGFAGLVSRAPAILAEAQRLIRASDPNAPRDLALTEVDLSDVRPHAPSLTFADAAGRWVYIVDVEDWMPYEAQGGPC